MVSEWSGQINQVDFGTFTYIYQPVAMVGKSTICTSARNQTEIRIFYDDILFFPERLKRDFTRVRESDPVVVPQSAIVHDGVTM